MKRFIAVLTALLLCLSYLPCAEASTADDIVSELAYLYDDGLNYLEQFRFIVENCAGVSAKDATEEWFEKLVASLADDTFRNSTISVGLALNNDHINDLLPTVYNTVFMRFMNKNYDPLRSGLQFMALMFRNDSAGARLSDIKKRLSEYIKGNPDSAENDILKELYQSTAQIWDLIENSENDTTVYQRIGEYQQIRREIRNSFDFVYDWPEYNHSLPESTVNMLKHMYDEIGLPFDSERASVKRNGKWGLIDTAGALIVPCRYDDISSIYDERAIVTLDEKKGVIDIDGRTIVFEGTYEDIGTYGQGLAPFMQNGKWGFIDVNGQIAIQPIYEDVGNYREGMVCVKTGGKWGAIDQSGNMIIAPQFAKAFAFHEGLAAVKTTDEGTDNTGYYINKDGEKAFDGNYQMGYDFQEGIARTDRYDKSSNKWYLDYIDNTGTVLFTLDDGNYSMLWNYSEGLAMVARKDVGIGFIDKQGQEVIPCTYKSVTAYGQGFHEGSIAVKNDSRYGVIDKDNNAVVPFAYEDIAPFNDGLCLVINDGFINILDANGNRVF